MSYKIPGVYIQEENAFPNSIVEVATAIPAFIGYTKQAIKDGQDVTLKPTRITSLSQYEKIFGGAPKYQFSVEPVDSTAPENSDDVENSNEFTFDSQKYRSKQTQGAYQLYTCLKLYFQNAGGPCFIVSVGGYEDGIAKDKLITGILPLKKEQEVTLLLCPDATTVANSSDFSEINTKMIEHCSEMKNRFAIVDVFEGFKEPNECIAGAKGFRETIGTDNLNYAASYYPWLNTNVIGDHEIDLSCFLNVDSIKKLAQDTLIGKGGNTFKWNVNELGEVIVGDGSPNQMGEGLVTIKVNKDGFLLDESGKQIPNDTEPYSWKVDDKLRLIDPVGSFIDKDGKTTLDGTAAVFSSIDHDGFVISWNIDNTVATRCEGLPRAAIPIDLWPSWNFINNISWEDKNKAHEDLLLVSSFYRQLLEEIKKQLNLLPPSAAMAGRYVLVDNDRGVWKAPTNISLNGVISPAVDLTHADQEGLKVPLDGKAVNVICRFTGQGTLVWGGRTLDGNSLDWRYINVRRTLIMLEESIRQAIKAYVFEPNTANTWVSIKSMVGSFLNGIWKRGGLAGASADDAYQVLVGLGETMDPEDILEGVMKVTVLVALVRPAEFIEIIFQQKLQES